jgi:phosphoenolpyruvate carboxylase
MQVTKDVSLLSQWMAVDMYIREIDNLSFELSMNRCNDQLATLANQILIKGLINLVLLSTSQAPSYFLLQI